jgi:hypothetical protein
MATTTGLSTVSPNPSTGWDVKSEAPEQAAPAKGSPTVSADVLTANVDLFERAMQAGHLQRHNFKHPAWTNTSLFSGFAGVIGGFAVTALTGGAALPLGIAIAGAGLAPAGAQGSLIGLREISLSRTDRKGGTTSLQVYPQELSAFVAKQNERNSFEKLALASFAEQLWQNMPSRFHDSSHRMITNNLERVAAESDLDTGVQGEAQAVGDLMAAITSVLVNPKYKYADEVSNALNRMSQPVREQVRPLLKELDKTAGKNAGSVSELIWNTLPPSKVGALEHGKE